jgi:hypothetical protein
MLLPGTCSAAADPECLKHLGGAFADVECYNTLSNALQAENQRLAGEIAVTIPRGNRSKSLLTGYEQDQLKSKKYCELSRDSLTEWVAEKPVQNPRYFYYDVAYYQCIYDNLTHQNRFLKQLLDNVSKR